MADFIKIRDEVLRISGVDPKKCMKCGKCSATCPAYEEMEFHPHQFVAMVDRGDIEPLMNSKSLYLCLSCMACVERCPRGVKPGKLVEAIRLVTIRQKDHSHLTADMIPAVLDNEMPQQAIVTAFRKYTK